MTLFLTILYLAAAFGVFHLARSVINVQESYRTGASIAAAVVWPAIAALLIGFLLLDLIEWGVRQLRAPFRGWPEE